jgi:nucleoside-diphosphate-sugar epimerase
LSGAPLRLTGGGKQSRSFCYVDDLVGGLMALMECEAADSHRPVNLGTPHEISVRQLAEKVIELVGSTSVLTDTPGEEGDPSRRCPDIARARKLLNFSPRVALEDGLRRTIEAMRDQVASSR